MNAGDIDLFSEDVGAWRLAFARAPGDAGSAPSVITVELGGVPRARLAVSRPSGDPEAAAAALRAKAMTWIEDYESRTHTGETGFGDLPG